MKERIVTRLKTCFTFISAALTFVLTIEMGARIDDAIKFDAPLWEKYSPERLRKYDENGIQVNVPNARFEKWQHNKLGFRGPDTAPLTGGTHVVCLGASESYGLYESAGKEWPAQLRMLLPASSYQVTNASVAGLVLQSFKPYVQKYVFPLKPDVIVCFVNPSLYALAWEKSHKLRFQEAPSLPIRHVGLTMTKPAPKPPIRTSTVTKVILANSRALPKVKQVFKRAVETTFPHMLQHYQVWNLEKQVRQTEAVRLNGEAPKNAVPDTLVAGFAADLDGLVTLIQSRGIKVMLTTYPTLSDPKNLAIYPQFALDSRRSMVEYTNRGLFDMQNKLNAAIAMVAAERRTLFVDSQSLIPKSTEYFGDVCHYTDKGAMLVAQHVASSLTNGSAPASHPAAGEKSHKIQFRQIRWGFQ